MLRFFKKLFGTAQDRLLKKYEKVVQQVNAWETQLSELEQQGLQEKTLFLMDRYQQGESLEDLLPEAYAVVKVACRRLCGTQVHVSGYDQSWDMVPYDVQILGAIAMHHGTIAEMQTGEGKTLTAVMPLYLNALTKKPVHLVTVNDYLASRDCQWVGFVLRYLGLSTGILTTETPLEKRKEIYQSDVVYATASELGFDYLRDNALARRKEEQVQRGFYFAIIDEIDSILIDEARTPLIISGPVPESRQMYDALKDSVANLVREQRNFCASIAAEAQKALEKAGILSRTEEVEPIKDKAMKKEVQEAFGKLWQLSKGMPRHKILKRLLENPDCRYEMDQLDIYYSAEQNKEERAKRLSELFIVVDEKNNEYELTDRGIQKWAESHLGHMNDFVMLDLGEEYGKIDSNVSFSDEEKLQKKIQIREEDARRKEKIHNLRQLLRAHLLMEKDVDYILQEGQIVIIDENTGRAQPGRRFSDGLHQAIEAKEAVTIQKETQTFATITLQNFFRMYDKMAGMTGTAMTESHEFKEIYNLDVLEIPTYKPCCRIDYTDQVYMTEREKYSAIVQELKELHKKGLPILIGTESVDASEKLSRILKQHQLPHTVLNAKHHAQEAEIIAHAGHKGAITISTNMAGRGTDIKLEKGVAELGGLQVIGTTRHQSRRIDRQLRGRSARLGDPGSSRFFVSFEDPLLRLFASPRITALLKRFRPPEGEAISARIIDRSIETAQKRIEQRNYTIRKHTLEYDDVMNKQRQAIYSFRNEVLWTTDMVQTVISMLIDLCELQYEDFRNQTNEQEEWNVSGFIVWLHRLFPVQFKKEQLNDIPSEEMIPHVTNRLIEALNRHIQVQNERIALMHQENFSDLHPAQEAIRSLMIHRIDELWQEHLLEMDHLRHDVHLRSVGQKDPLVEFKEEAFHLFEKLSIEIREQISRDIFQFEFILPRTVPSDSFLEKVSLEKDRLLGFDEEKIELPLQEKTDSSHRGVRVGRNELCPCGSGKKYKKCCGKEEISS